MDTTQAMAATATESETVRVAVECMAPLRAISDRRDGTAWLTPNDIGFAQYWLTFYLEGLQQRARLPQLERELEAARACIRDFVTPKLEDMNEWMKATAPADSGFRGADDLFQKHAAAIAAARKDGRA